jgi:hypothetical protein
MTQVSPVTLIWWFLGKLLVDLREVFALQSAKPLSWHGQLLHHVRHGGNKGRGLELRA